MSELEELFNQGLKRVSEQYAQDARTLEKRLTDFEVGQMEKMKRLSAAFHSLSQQLIDSERSVSSLTQSVASLRQSLGDLQSELAESRQRESDLLGLLEVLNMKLNTISD